MGGRIVVRTLPRHGESKEMWVNEKKKQDGKEQEEKLSREVE